MKAWDVVKDAWSLTTKTPEGKSQLKEVAYAMQAIILRALGMGKPSPVNNHHLIK